MVLSPSGDTAAEETTSSGRLGGMFSLTGAVSRDRLYIDVPRPKQIFPDKLDAMHDMFPNLFNSDRDAQYTFLSIGRVTESKGNSGRVVSPHAILRHLCRSDSSFGCIMEIFSVDVRRAR